jgi:hypothetical protein
MTERYVEDGVELVVNLVHLFECRSCGHHVYGCPDGPTDEKGWRIDGPNHVCPTCARHGYEMAEIIDDALEELAAARVGDMVIVQSQHRRIRAEVERLRAEVDRLGRIIASEWALPRGSAARRANRTIAIGADFMVSGDPDVCSTCRRPATHWTADFDHGIHVLTWCDECWATRLEQGGPPRHPFEVDRAGWILAARIARRMAHAALMEPAAEPAGGQGTPNPAASSER